MTAQASPNTDMLHLSGKRFGRLTVLEATGKNSKGCILWRCICDCGKHHIVLGYSINAGRTNSCGCLRYESGNKKASHRRTKTREFVTWTSIKDRCLNKNSRSYKDYGGRGISICDEWANSFDQFYIDMGDRPDGTSIERIDNNLGYFAKNCVWATPNMQNRNRRNVVMFLGKTQTEWAKELGVTVQAIAYRMKKFGTPKGNMK